MNDEQRTTIDVNCDMGEGSGADAALMPLLTSANIACGGHAGNEGTMLESVRLAMAFGVGIGAHPSHPDREGFGRQPKMLPLGQLRAEIETQIRALQSIARAAGTGLRHVKPHGALYNQAASNRELAAVIGEAVRGVDPLLIIVALSGSAEVDVLRQMGMRVAREAFVDRGYAADGTLVARSLPGALVTDPEFAAARAVRVVRDGRMAAVDGTDLAIAADTLCIHSDTPGAVEVARAVRGALLEAGIHVVPLADSVPRPRAPGPRPQ